MKNTETAWLLDCGYKEANGKETTYKVKTSKKYGKKRTKIFNQKQIDKLIKKIYKKGEPSIKLFCIDEKCFFAAVVDEQNEVFMHKVPFNGERIEDFEYYLSDFDDYDYEFAVLDEFNVTSHIVYEIYWVNPY